jgi:hypothetical protein
MSSFPESKGDPPSSVPTTSAQTPIERRSSHRPWLVVYLLCLVALLLLSVYLHWQVGQLQAQVNQIQQHIPSPQWEYKVVGPVGGLDKKTVTKDIQEAATGGWQFLGVISDAGTLDPDNPPQNPRVATGVFLVLGRQKSK